MSTLIHRALSTVLTKSSLTSLKFRSMLGLCLAGFLVLFSSGCSDNGSGEKITGKTGDRLAKASDSDSANVPATKKVNTSATGAASSAGKATSKSDSNVEPEKVPQNSPKKIAVSTEPDINEPEFHDALSEAIDGYLLYGMVNSIVLPAPTDCRAPESDEPKPMISESEHEASHGNKLYFLFAKKIGHYVSPGGQPAPVGQVVVKESWTSSPANPSARNLIKHASGNRINPRVKVGDQTLEIGQRKNFFVMTKLAEDTPKTDQGWVYGVIDADSKEVLASGKIASCMSCHVEATNDRLFGSKHVIGLEETVIDVEAPEPKAPKKEAPKKEGPKKEEPKKETARAESPNKETTEKKTTEAEPSQADSGL